MGASGSLRLSPAVMKVTAYALSLGSGDGSRRYRPLVARDRHNPPLLGGDGSGRHRHRRLLRAGAARPKALARLAARSLCRDLPLHAALDPDRLVLLRAADPVEFLIAGLARRGAWPHALHGCVLH